MSGERVSGGGVTVVVPHYGAHAPTLALLGDLARQEASRPLEVVVVDDHSPEPFPDVDGVTVVRRERNGGFGAAVNTGVARATQPLALVLNSDIRLGPHVVESLVRAAEPWQPCVAGPLLLDPSGEPAPSARHFPTTSQQATEWLSPLARFRGHRALREAVGHDTRAVPGAVLPVDWLVGAALLVPTGVLRSAGGFDEGFYMNAEEVDLQRRLRELGIPSVFVGTTALTHVGGGSSDPAARRTWLVRARFRYADRWGGRRRLTAALGGASLLNAVVNAGRQAAGRDVDAWATLRSELSLVRSGAASAADAAARDHSGAGS